MSDIPIYQGTEETAVTEVLNASLEKAFGDLLAEPPIHEIVPGDLVLEDIVDIGDGYKSSGRSPVFAMISVASTLHARSKKGKGIWSTWVLTTLRLNDTPSEVKILFQGGFVKDNTYGFNGVSMGFVHDVMVPRGFACSYVNKNAVFSAASISSDEGETIGTSPYTSVIGTQSSYHESKMNQLLGRLPPYSMFEASGRISGTTYQTTSPPLLMVSPRHGRTIISLKFSPYTNQGKSQCAVFMMPGEKKPVKLEISVPHPENFKLAYDVLKDAMDIPENLTTHVEATGELAGGVDTYLALETARQRYRPDIPTFTLWDLVQSSPKLNEVVSELKNEHSKYDFNVMSGLKYDAMKKL